MKTANAKPLESLARTRIADTLMDCGVPRMTAEREAEKAIACIKAQKPRKLTAPEKLRLEIEEAVSNAESYRDALRIILDFTPRCVKLREDLPFSFFYNDRKLKHDFTDDFQYCCSALLARYPDHGFAPDSFRHDYAPDAWLSSDLLKRFTKHLQLAVIERFVQIYMEVFGPNGFDIQGEEYDKIVKIYGVDPKNFER